MTDDISTLEVPPGYRWDPSSSPFVDHIGPIYQKLVVPADGPTEHWLAVRLRPHHVNTWGFAHGSLMSAMAELATNAPAYVEGGPPTVIVQLSMNFIAPPKLGALFEACGYLTKATRTMFFTEARGEVAGELMFTASAIVKAVKV